MLNDRKKGHGGVRFFSHAGSRVFQTTQGLVGRILAWVSSREIHPFTLRFTGRFEYLEKTYSDDHFNRSILQMRIALLIGCSFYAVFGLLDAVIAPEQRQIFWFIRYAIVCPLALSIFGVSFLPSFKKTANFWFFLLCVVAGFGIVIMTALAVPPASYTYYAGLILVIIYLFTFVEIEFLWALSASWLIIAFYETLTIGFTEIPFEIFLNNNFFIIGSNIYCMIAGYSIEYFERKNFLLTTLLSEERDKVTRRSDELEAKSRELEQANRLKSVFLANMSHELRTPLNSVIALTGVLNRRLRGAIPEEEYGYLDIIERNGRHLLSLINDILDLSRIEAGREELHIYSFSARVMAEDVVEMIKPLALEKGLTLVNNVGDDLPLLHSDPDKVRHILQNLAGNAVKFTEAGSVEITAWQSDGELSIAVSDTGIGIPVDALERVFEEFHQVDDSASRKYGGTGLSLAIAQKYAHMIGGCIAVASTPGQGSTFTLRLPLALAGPTGGSARDDQALALPESVAVEALESAQAPGNRSGSGKPKVLLVEDNPDNRRTMQALLKDTCAVIEAGDGRTGVEQARHHKPDLILMDLALPVMDGYEALAAIREDEELRGIPVVAVTASAMKGDREAILARGFDGYLPKPIDAKLLNKTIAEVLYGKE
jgi:signal transduction histidine kinase